MKTKSGNSNFQQKIEKKMLLWYAQENNLVFDKDPPILEGCSVQIDGYSEKRLVACEVYAHVGKLKSGQVHKVAQDALKLIYLDKKMEGDLLGKKHKKVLLFADEETRRPFEISKNIKSRGNAKWIADCIQKFKIKTFVYPLSSEDKKELLKRQKKQGDKFRN